jgi:hypothetical protein
MLSKAQCRRAVRALAMASSKVPIVLVAGCQGPRICGHGAYWLSPGGYAMRFASLDRAERSLQTRIKSTLRVEVGAGWLVAGEVPLSYFR